METKIVFNDNVSGEFPEGSQLYVKMCNDMAVLKLHMYFKNRTLEEILTKLQIFFEWLDLERWWDADEFSTIGGMNVGYEIYKFYQYMGSNFIEPLLQGQIILTESENELLNKVIKMSKTVIGLI